MKINLKKLLSLLFTCVMLTSLLPMEALAASSNFTVAMKEPADNNLEIGETVSIPVVVGHTEGVTSYNSFDMRFSYDASILELTSTAISGMSVTVNKGTVRVLRYGSDLAVGKTAFTLTFKAIKSGETTIRAAAAKVGIRETAQEKDAADAVILNDVPLKVTADTYKINVADTSGGTVTVSPKEAQAGTRVEIKATPKSGYEMKTLTVTDANGKNVSVNTDNNGKYSFVMPESDVTIKVTFGVKSTSAADQSNPKTGDDFGLAAWNATAIISLAVLTILILNKKKCRWL